jgi:hypothetical protein
MRLSKFAKTNFILAFIIVIVAFVYPIFIQKVFYSNKSKEAISIASTVEKVQNLNYINLKKYISIKKGDVEELSKKFNIKQSDIKFYDYSIFTTFNSYTLYAEPKIQYLKSRDIAPKIYVYHKQLNHPPIIKWK